MLRKLILKPLKWLSIILLLVVISIAAPILYLEFACRAEFDDRTPYEALIQDPNWQRKEANTFLTYPEWHIVYAYEDMAAVLKTGDEQDFDYFSSIAGFWSSACKLKRQADARGGADGQTRTMLYTIGGSFTLEMGIKAIYEETIGRYSSWSRGETKTPQDVVSLEVAADYAKFLQQLPWYKYDFEQALEKLKATEITDTVRSYERKFGLGLEWRAKAAYAKLIAQAVEATDAQAQLRIRSVVSGVSKEQLSLINDVVLINTASDKITIETPRYRTFTQILTSIAKMGGTVMEIAGNDEIMLSVLHPGDTSPTAAFLKGKLATLPVQQNGLERSLILVPVKELASFLSNLQQGRAGLEHIYDY